MHSFPSTVNSPVFFNSVVQWDCCGLGEKILRRLLSHSMARLPPASHRKEKKNGAFFQGLLQSINQSQTDFHRDDKHGFKDCVLLSNLNGPIVVKSGQRSGVDKIL